VTAEQQAREKLKLAMSELEVVLDWFNCDEAFGLFVKFESEVWAELRKLPEGYVFK
jgi:hypothetical protein